MKRETMDQEVERLRNALNTAFAGVQRRNPTNVAQLNE
jgi:hypothetical protein